MSALTPKADIDRAHAHVCFVPTTDSIAKRNDAHQWVSSADTIAPASFTGAAQGLPLALTWLRRRIACPLWLIHVIANSRRNPPLSVVGPIGDKTWCRRFVREVPEADIN